MGLSFYWIDADDNEEQLGDTANRVVSRHSGLGMAPIDRFLQAIPFEHQQKHVGMRFRPRIVQLLINDKRSTVAAQQSAADTLMARLNPDLGEGKLKILLDDGTERRLDCMVIAGPELSQENRLGSGALRSYLVRFQAANPFLYDPTQKTESDNFNGATPVDISCNNAGNMGSFLVITIAGLVTHALIALSETGEFIDLDYEIGEGDTVTIDCAPDQKTCKLQDGTNLAGYVSKTSAYFDLERGTNTVQISADAGSSGLCTARWYNRYTGI